MCSRPRRASSPRFRDAPRSTEAWPDRLPRVNAKAVSQYPARHAEPEAEAADRLEGAFGHVVVVPPYGEGQSLFDTLGSVPLGPRGRPLGLGTITIWVSTPVTWSSRRAAGMAAISSA